jgi:hypothetical protein
MKAISLLPLVAFVAGLAIEPTPVPEVQTLPPITRKDTVVKRIRYGPFKLAKAVVR